MKFLTSSILTALNPKDVIGTKVTDREAFFDALTAALETYDTTKDRVEGQHFVVLPEAAFGFVSAGDGVRSDNAEDYVARAHRGRVELFLRREKAGKVKFLATVVYTVDAYLDDPDVTGDEVQRVQKSDATHVIVAVIASSGPQAPLTPYRLVHNLAGGNNEADTWDVDTIRAKAEESKTYWDQWAVVAD